MSPATPPKPATHVVFDVDGLLIDSERYYSEALASVARRHGKHFTFELKREMMGTKPLEGARLALERLGLSGALTPERFVELYEAEMRLLCPQIRLMPGARRLVQHLAAKRVPMAVATGAADYWFRCKTAHLGALLVEPFAHHVFAGSDPEVARGKPSPDVFLVAARRFRPPPRHAHDVLVFEDALNGVRAAQAAGMQVVLVPDPRLDAAAHGVRPTLELSSLEHFRPELFGLPPFEDQPA